MNAANAFTAMYEQIVAEAAERVRKELEETFVRSYQDRTLNSREAADHLGISTQTLYKLCAEKRIKHIPVGSLRSTKPEFRFRQSVLDTWMREQEEKSIQ